MDHGRIDAFGGGPAGRTTMTHDKGRIRNHGMTLTSRASHCSEQFVSAQRAPVSIVLDVDATDDPEPDGSVLPHRVAQLVRYGHAKRF